MPVAHIVNVPYEPMKMVPYCQVPIIINSFNRLDSLRRLVTWLLAAGHAEITVLDNASTYPPLQAYLGHLRRTKVARVIPLGGNFGHRSLWICDILTACGIESEFVYTDPDVVPAASCAKNVVETLQSVLDENPEINKAGLGLRIDDIPDHYRHKASVTTWERQFWRTPAACGLFFAPIDTTFALYRPRGSYSLGDSIRTGPPNVASHDAWYMNLEEPTAEDRFYARTARNGNWAAGEMRPWLRNAIDTMTGNEPKLLHLRFGRESLPGYVEIDDVGALASIASGSIDGVLDCHGVTENATGELLGSLHRICKDGASVLLRGLNPSTGFALKSSIRAPLGGSWMVDREVRVVANARYDEELVMCLRVAKTRGPFAIDLPDPEVMATRLITSLTFKTALPTADGGRV